MPDDQCLSCFNVLRRRLNDVVLGVTPTMETGTVGEQIHPPIFGQASGMLNVRDRRAKEAGAHPNFHLCPKIQDSRLEFEPRN